MQISDLIEASGNTWLSEDLIKHKQIDLSACVKKTMRGVNYYTSHSIYKMEREIANIICEKLFQKRQIADIRSIAYFIEKWEWENHSSLSDEQRDAVYMAVQNPFSILTGGPGTGKTRVIEVVAYVLRMLGRKNILFCAPTGKAAQRIKESTNEDASTAHKLMGLSKTTTKLLNISCDLLVADEASMFDIHTFYCLLKSLNGPLLLAGDIEQLESVGAGSVLRDLIECKLIPLTRLTKTFRQKEENTVFGNMLRIVEGNTDLKYDENFILLDPMKTNVVNVFLAAQKKYGNVCCLSPYRIKGNYSTNVINSKIQEALNNNTSSWSGLVQHIGESNKRKVTYRVGDSVMNLVNEDVINGDVGDITKIDNSGITVLFGSYEKKYSYQEVGKITLAYAMTVHRSQGSEYPAVIIVLPPGSSMLTRNLLFTAVSRAKEAVIIIGLEESVISAINKSSKFVRTTFLCEEIIAQYNRRINKK